MPVNTYDCNRSLDCKYYLLHEPPCCVEQIPDEGKSLYTANPMKVVFSKA